MSGRCTKRDVGISSRLAIVSASSTRTSLAETPPAGPSPPPQVPYSYSKPLSPQTPPPKAAGGEVVMYWRNKVCATPLTSLCWTVDICGGGGGVSLQEFCPPRSRKTR